MKAFKDEPSKEGGVPFFDQVKKIAMTDSCNFYKEEFGDKKEYFKDNCVHYAASQKKLGEPLSGRMASGLAPEVSAGHHAHEWTTGMAWPLIAKQFFGEFVPGDDRKDILANLNGEKVEEEKEQKEEESKEEEDKMQE